MVQRVVAQGRDPKTTPDERRELKWGAYPSADEGLALRCQVSHYMQLNSARTQAINRVRSLFQQEFIDLRLGTVGPRAHSFSDPRA